MRKIEAISKGSIKTQETFKGYQSILVFKRCLMALETHETIEGEMFYSTHSCFYNHIRTKQFEGS